LPSDNPGISTTTARGSFSSTTRPTALDPSSSATTPRASPSHARIDLPHINTERDVPLPLRGNSSGVWSTVATPGVTDAGDDERNFDFQPVAGTSSASRRASAIQPAVEARDASASTSRNVRFTGPDGAPLSPSESFVEPRSYPEPSAPPPTVFEDSPSAGTSALPSAPPLPPSGRPRGSSNATQPVGSATVGNGNASGTSPRRTSTSRSAVPDTHGLGLTPTAVPTPPLPRQAPSAPTPVPVPSAPVALTRKQTEQIQKHARWAISALDYDDVETAKSELRKGLAMLGG
jgi:vacuolar protein sorting-associated protein VTA1